MFAPYKSEKNERVMLLCLRVVVFGMERFCSFISPALHNSNFKFKIGSVACASFVFVGVSSPYTFVHPLPKIMRIMLGVSQHTPNLNLVPVVDSIDYASNLEIPAPPLVEILCKHFKGVAAQI